MTWSPEVIVLGVFFAGMFFIAMRARNSTLRQLTPLPDERTLCEDEGVEVEQGRTRRKTRFTNCVVRLTNRRIIVAQRVAFRKDAFLRHVVHVPSRGATSLKGVHVTCHLEPRQIEIDRNTGRIEMPLGDGLLTGGQTLHFTTAFVPTYGARFRGESANEDD